jgi:cell division protein FtsB
MQYISYIDIRETIEDLKRQLKFVTTERDDLKSVIGKLQDGLTTYKTQLDRVEDEKQKIRRCVFFFIPLVCRWLNTHLLIIPSSCRFFLSYLLALP